MQAMHDQHVMVGLCDGDITIEQAELLLGVEVVEHYKKHLIRYCGAFYSIEGPEVLLLNMAYLSGVEA